QGAPPVEVRAQIPVLESLAAQAAIVIEHTRLYERIRRSEARYASLVESSPEAILIVQDGRIRFFNQAAEELWGYKVDEVLGTPFDRYWTEESRVELRKCRQKRPAGEAVSHRCEMVALSKSGAEIPVEVDIALVEYTGEAAMMLFVRDISARKKLDRLREDLSHMLIHDLRNPLNTISGVVRVLEEEADAADPMIVRQTADIISRSVQRMMTLIDNYLEIGRLEAGQMPVRKGPIAPDQVVAEAIDTMRSLAAAKEIALVAEVTPDIPVVAMDGDLIVRVLINLLDNAIKFSPRGKKVKVGLVHEDDGLLFSVSDQGPGIPLEEQERVFHKYAQLTRSKQRGLGLGLAFCKLAVETHGGRIWVESEPGDSTTFYFILPPETG
nr:PAS domain S-box protein [Anaerolineae bacterium]